MTALVATVGVILLAGIPWWAYGIYYLCARWRWRRAMAHERSVKW